MSTLLIRRAYSVLMLSMAALLVAGLLAPIVAVASTDLVAGDTAVVNNPDGTGAYLRTDTAVLDDSTIAAELPQGSTVWVMEAPVYNDTGVWVYVAAEGYGPGWVSTSLLEKVTTDTAAEETGADVEEAPETGAPVATLPWLEPTDIATVVDPNLALPVEGLAVRTAIDGELLGYAQVGSTLDVTGEREWVGENNYVRVNFNGAGAYVDGAFVALESEAVVEEPTEEVIWVETEVPTEVVPVETEIVTEEPTEVIPVETEIVTEVPTEVVPVETEIVTEEPTEVIPVETEVVTEEPTEVVPVETEVVTEEPTEVVPVETEVVTEEPTEVVPVETEVVTEEPTEVVPVETEVVAEVVAPNSERVSVQAPATAEVITETVVASPAATAPEKASATTPVATTTVVPTAVATEAPAKATAPTVTATAVPTQVSTPAPIASTAKAFDAKQMIGSATVTGTTSGLLCRTQPSPSAPVLMTLAEGTKVLVSAEPVNGYLGIDCGGLQGFADVNYLWSGGAGDEEIRAARMNVVVTGTGNGLNCRTGAGLNYPVITTVFDGTSLVTRGAASNGWTPVTCAGKNGFVSTTWIEPAAGSTSTPGTSTATTGTARVNTGGDGLYCRSGAGTSYGVITVLSHGSTVAVRGAAQGAWIPVTCGGKAGFAHGDYLSVTAGSGTSTPAPSTGTGTATGSVTVANTGGQGLNCRSGAGTSHSIITTLALGQTVKTRSGSVSGWTAVICGGTNGFVSSEFVTGGTASAPTAPKPTAPAPSTGSGSVPVGTHLRTTDAVNLRYSASLSSSVSTVVPAGTVVKSTGAVTNSYYPVNYDGLTGYIHVNYLLKTSEALSERGGSGSPTSPAPAPAPAPAPVTSSPTGSALVNYAMRYKGYPYVWATHGPASFDCSGFTYWVVLNVTGKNIGWGTWTQVSAGTPVSKANLQPGDLVFFQNTYTAGLSHVGLYIGNGQFIHAQNEETGVVISDLNSSYYGPRWYGAVRL